MLRGVLVAALVSTTAHAAPMVMSHSGRILDGGDVPLTQAGLKVGFKIFKALNPPSENETSEWESGDCSVDVFAGYYSVLLGETCGANLPSEVLATTEARYLEVSVGGSALKPRLRLAAVPKAILASDALALGGTPAAAFVQHDDLAKEGSAAVSWKRLVDVPAGFADGEDSAFEGVVLAQGANLAGDGTAQAPLSLALADGAVKSAQIESLDWSKLTNRPPGLDDGDDGITSVVAGTGLSGSGLAGDPLEVKYGTKAGTAAAGNDPRFGELEGRLDALLALPVPIVTEWQAFDLAAIDEELFPAGEKPNWSAHWRRVGSNMELSIHASVRQPGATLAKLPLPGGVKIDYSHAEPLSPHLFFVGTVVRVANDAHSLRSRVQYVAASGEDGIQLYVDSPPDGKALTPANWDELFKHADRMSIHASIPIVGWTATEPLSAVLARQ